GRSDRVDPHPKRLARRLFQILANQAARSWPIFRRDRIFEIENKRVGWRTLGLGKLLLAVAGYKEERAEDHQSSLFRSIRAVRLQLATNSPRWLKARCRKRTIPFCGRDLLSRNSSTSVSTCSVSP